MTPSPRFPRSRQVSRARLAALLAIVVVSLTVLAPAAQANTVIADCNDDGRLDRDYSRSELKKALENLPTDIDEYSNCRDVITQALDAKLSGRDDKRGGGGGGGAGHQAAIAKAITPADRKRVADEIAAQVQAPSDGPVATVDGAPIQRGPGRTLASAAAPGTPTSLILAGLGFLLLVVAGLVSRYHDHPLVGRLTARFGANDPAGPQL